MAETISIPWDGGSMALDRDLLATAVLVRMDTPGRLDSSRTTAQIAQRLRDEHGFRDPIVYAVASRICITNGIEP